VREESQLDEMRSAIRGDFERLAERRGEQELLRVSEPEPHEPGIQPEIEPDIEPEIEPDIEPEIEPQPRSWLSRLIPS
jgi:hypothetical protein